MTDDDCIHACWMMERIGGHFASALAKCYYVADSTNRMKLRLAFNEYFERYWRTYDASEP